MLGTNHLLRDLESKTAVRKPCVYVFVSGIMVMLCDLTCGAVFISQNPEGFCVVPSSEIKLRNNFSFSNGEFGLIFKEGL